MFCKYRVVLSVDGCGMRGVIPLRIMDYLHRSMSELDEDLDVTSWVDLFAATSASSIFTGALMLRDAFGKTRYTPNDLLQFYMKRGKQVFTENTGLDPENSIYPLTFVLDHFFGGVSLNDLRNHFLFVARNDVDNQLASFTSVNDRTHSMPLSKVMMACSAQEGKYPSMTYANNRYSDACQTFRNPSFLAYQQAKMLYASDHIILISIGVGDEKEPDSQAKRQADEAHQLMKQSVLENEKLIYYRFQPEMNSGYLFEHVSDQQSQMLEIADEFIFNKEERFRELLRLMAIKAA